MISFLGATVVPPVSTKKNKFKIIYGLIRSIRIKAQRLDTALYTIEEKASEKIARLRNERVQAAAKESASLLDRNKPQIDGLFNQLEAGLASDPDAINLFSDEVMSISSDWQELTEGEHWPHPGEPTDQILEMTSEARKLLHNIIYHCGLITIPSRLNEQLDKLYVGESRSFKALFGDELPKEEDQVKLLEYLHQYPGAINGIIDVKNGLVYRASPNILRRFASYILILATAAVGGYLAYSLLAIGQSLGIPGLPTDVTNIKLLFGYLTVLIGGVVHIGVDALKQVKQASSSATPSLLAIDSWLLWLHIRELYIAVGVIWLWLGFLGLVFYLKDIQFVTAFLVGYSIDSFIDLFMQRFTADVGRGSTELSTRLKAS